MTLFRNFLVLIFISIVVYTLITGLNHGWNLVPVFFGDMIAMTWRGQFNFDFMTFLMLSGLWVAWRNGFTAPAIALAVVAVFFGMLFLSGYLLYLIARTQGDMARILLGVQLDDVPTRT